MTHHNSENINEHTYAVVDDGLDRRDTFPLDARVNNGMRKNWVNLTALWLGAMATVTPVLGLLYAVAAIMVGLRGRKWADAGEASNRALGTTGLVLGVVALVLGVLFLIFGGTLLASVNMNNVDLTPTVN